MPSDRWIKRPFAAVQLPLGDDTILVVAEIASAAVKFNRGMSRDFIWYTFVPAIATLLLLGALLGFVDWKFLQKIDFAKLWPYRFALLEGLWATVFLTGLSVFIGLIAGTALAVGMQVQSRPLRAILSAYVEIFRNTPLVLQLFWIHFALPGFTGISTSPWQTGLIAMSLQSSAYLADAPTWMQCLLRSGAPSSDPIEAFNA